MVGFTFFSSKVLEKAPNDWGLVKFNVGSVLKTHAVSIIGALVAFGVGVICGTVSVSVGASSHGIHSSQSSQTPKAFVSPSEETSANSSLVDISHSVFEQLPAAHSLTNNPSLPEGSLEPVSDSKFPAAKNKLELDFFKRADASCRALKEKGVKLYTPDGGYEFVTLDSTGYFAGNAFDSTGKFVARLNFDDAGPSICDPTFLNEQVVRGNSLYASNYLLESLDGVEYIWHSHHGGSDLSTVTMYFTDGLVSEFWGMDHSAAWIRYGLNALEKKSALHIY